MSANEAGTTDDPATENVADMSHAVSVLLAAATVEDTLQLVVDLATSTIDGCDYAGVFLLDADAIVARVHTDLLVIEIDELQQHLGQGPCIDAIHESGTFYAEDLTDDPRWPTFGPQAVTKGVRSVLALQLFGGGPLGTLNLYSRYANAFGVIDWGKALVLAAFAGFAISTAIEHEDERRQIESLQARLATREMIGQAQGILMERERVAPHEAFDILRRASQHLNRKLREVAQNLVDTGERPDTGTPPLGRPAGSQHADPGLGHPRPVVPKDPQTP